MKISFCLPLLLLLFLPSISHSQTIRHTSFDDRPACEEGKGVWREFGNGCVDECHSKFDRFSICTQAITYGCDCGKGRCWNGESCITVRDYKKTFDAEKEAEAKILAEAKKKRQEAAKINEQNVISNLGKKITSSVQSSQSVQKTEEVVAPEKVAPQPETEAPPVASDTNKVEIPEAYLRQEKAKADEAKAKLDGANKAKQGDTAKQKNNASDTSSDPLALPVIPLPN